METLPYIPYERFIVKITGNDLKQPVWSRRLKFRKTAQGIVDRFACFKGLLPELIDTKPPHKPKKKKSTKQSTKQTKKDKS